jgi:hypothetical protein
MHSKRDLHHRSTRAALHKVKICEVVEIKSVAFIELDRCCCEALVVI